MRLRIALRKLRHSALAISPEDEAELLRQCKTVQALGLADFEQLSRSSGGRLSATALQRLALELTNALAPPISPATVLCHDRAVNMLLRTGLPDLDWLLGGGLATGEVTEIIGGPGAGKTQLCLLACAARVALPDGGGVLYLDTGGSFRPERVYRLAQQLSASSSSSHGGGGHSERERSSGCRARLDERVLAKPVSCLSDLVHALEALDCELQDAAATDAATDDAASSASNAARNDAESAPPPPPPPPPPPLAARAWLRSLRLLVVDSIFGALVAEHTAESKTAAGGQQARLQVLLRGLAVRHGLAVLVTNGVSTASTAAAAMASVGGASGGAAFGGQPEPRATFGQTWHHTAQTRLLLRAVPTVHVHDAATAIVQCVKSPWTLRPLVLPIGAEGTGTAVRIHFKSRPEIAAERADAP